MTKRRTLGKRRRRNTQYTRTKNKTKYFRKTRGGMLSNVPPPPLLLYPPPPLYPPLSSYPPPPPPPPMPRTPYTWPSPAPRSLLPQLRIPGQSLHFKGYDIKRPKSWTP